MFSLSNLISENYGSKIYPKTFKPGHNVSKLNSKKPKKFNFLKSSNSETYDVYVAEATPLLSGFEKHTISVFVADEAGLINRVAGVFARRGANIESLAVGLDTDMALFTIVVLGTQSTVDNLVKQLRKLVKVRYVEDMTNSTRVERELVLIKVHSSGAVRTEIMQLSEIFRARVVDVSEKYLTMAVTGDPGKTAAFHKSLAKYVILAVARTGKISLRRGERLLETGSTGSKDQIVDIAGEELEEGSIMALLPSSIESYDVYVDDYNVLGSKDDNYISNDPSMVSIVVSNFPGVLNQVTGVFARRGCNVQSLAVGPSEHDGISRITMVVPACTCEVQKLLNQVQKLVAVESATNLSQAPSVHRELMLIKVNVCQQHRLEINNLVQIFHGDIVDISSTTMIIAISGRDKKLLAFQDLCAAYGVLEVAKTGRVALIRESGVDTRFLEGFRLGNVTL
jgi:acetolactate synthase-1/3 small subunit